MANALAEAGVGGVARQRAASSSVTDAGGVTRHGAPVQRGAGRPSNSSAVPPSRRRARPSGSSPQRADQRAGLRLAERERVVGAQHHALGAEQCRAGSAARRRRAPASRSRSAPQVARAGGRAECVVSAAQVRAHVEAVLDAADGAGEAAAAVGEGRCAAAAAAPARRRRSASRPRRDCLRRHADQPRQPVLAACRSPPIMSHGCTKTAAPRSLAASKNANSSGASRFLPLTWVPICTPCRPSSSMQRSSSRDRQVAAPAAARVPRPAKRVGWSRHDAGDVVVEQPCSSSASLGLAQ